MLFNSSVFPVFLIIVLFFYYALRSDFRKQNFVLLIASYIFYGWWDARFLFLIVFSTIVDYICAHSIGNGALSTARKRLLSAHLIGSVILFLGLDWHVLWVQCRYGFRPDMHIFRTDPLTVSVFLVSVVLVILFHICYPLFFRLTEPRRQRMFLYISVVVNLTILGIFKYLDFFAASLVNLTNLIPGWNVTWVDLNIILPVGISFYTFQTMSYTIDVYRKEIQPTRSITELATYVAFFPQLVAGPIERGKNLIPQFQRLRSVNRGMIKSAAWLIVWGLYKKVVVADNMALIVNATFGPFDAGGSVVPEDGFRLLLAIYAFALQIYCDFSGYTDIARGVARLMGFEIMINFSLPYFAISPSDFWRRWHISLSSWLRDYLYISLGGNRGGERKTYRNLMLTMLLGGLWHGASWTFVLWGLFHGLILVIYRRWLPGADRRDVNIFSLITKWFVMFHLVCISWLIFRARNLMTIKVFLLAIFGSFSISPLAVDYLSQIAFFSWFLIVFQWIQFRKNDVEPMKLLPGFVQLNFWIFVIVSLLRLSAPGGKEFIYFAF